MAVFVNTSVQGKLQYKVNGQGKNDKSKIWENPEYVQVKAAFEQMPVYITITLKTSPMDAGERSRQHEKD